MTCRAQRRHDGCARGDQGDQVSTSHGRISPLQGEQILGRKTRGSHCVADSLCGPGLYACALSGRRLRCSGALPGRRPRRSDAWLPLGEDVVGLTPGRVLMMRP